MAAQAAARLADGRARGLNLPAATTAARAVAPGASVGRDAARKPPSLWPFPSIGFAGGAHPSEAQLQQRLPLPRRILLWRQHQRLQSVPQRLQQPPHLLCRYPRHQQHQPLQQQQVQCRSLAHWASALRHRLFPAAAARLAVPLTAACAAAAAAGGYGHYHGLFGSGPAPSAAAAGAAAAGGGPTHGSSHHAAAAAALPYIAPPHPAPPADVRSCRAALEARGFAHPGLQPGAAWGSLAPTRGGVGGGGGAGGGGGGGGAAAGDGEMHAMFEYLLLFPA